MTSSRRFFLAAILALAASSPVAAPARDGKRVAARAEKRFELEGKVVGDDGRPFARVSPVVFLTASSSPFSARTIADRGGRFRFKNLAAGIYTIVVAVPKVGLLRKSVDVGASFADARGCVRGVFEVERRPSAGDPHSVPVGQLQVPHRAVDEAVKAQDRLEASDAAGAIRHLERAVEIAPHYADAWNTLGTIAYKSRAYARAEEHFRRALEADPESFAPLVNLGGALLSQGKIQPSLLVNQRAVRTRPDDALAHSQLGQSYFFLDRLDEAEVHLKAAKELDPAHFSLPQLVLAEVYRRKENLDAAIDELEEFLRQHPDSAFAPQVALAIERARAERSAGSPPKQ